MYLGKRSLIAISVLVFTIFMINTAFATVYDSANNAKNAVQNAALSSFKTVELKTAYLHDLEGIDTTLVIADDETETASKNQLYQDALNTVNSLISKTDGCEANGTPDTEDWMVSCVDSATVHTALNQLATDISALIQ